MDSDLIQFGRIRFVLRLLINSSFIPMVEVYSGCSILLLMMYVIDHVYPIVILTLCALGMNRRELTSNRAKLLLGSSFVLA